MTMSLADDVSSCTTVLCAVSAEVNEQLIVTTDVIDRLYKNRNHGLFSAVDCVNKRVIMRL